MKIALLSALALFTAGAVRANDISIGDFESGDLSGWSASNPLAGGVAGNPLYPDKPSGVILVTQLGDRQSYPDRSGPRTAESGDYFLSVSTRTTGGYWISTPGSLDITVSTQVNLNAGDSISGWASFLNGDIIPQDSSYVKIYDSGGNLVSRPWYETSGSGQFLGEHTTLTYGQMGDWTPWDWAATQAGEYTIVLGTSTGGDNELDSVAYFDAVTIHTVPDFGTTAILLAVGMLPLARYRRRLAVL